MNRRKPMKITDKIRTMKANSEVKLALAISEAQAGFKEQTKAARGAKRIVTTVVTALIASTLMTVAAFADGADLSFFNTAIDVLKTVVILIGAGVAVWGVINLLEGYGNDNPGAKSQGMKQLMAGVGVALIGILLVPQLKTIFTNQTS